MAHDPYFEARIANALFGKGVSAEPKKMFGGVAFMVNGNMSVGITNKGYFMVRVDPARHEELLGLPGARPMDFTHRPMKGFLFVEAEVIADRRALDRWIELSLEYVRTLPVKKVKEKTAAKSATPTIKAKGR